MMRLFFGQFQTEFLKPFRQACRRRNLPAAKTATGSVPLLDRFGRFLDCDQNVLD